MRETRDPRLQRHARTLRADMTEAERRLWWALRHRLGLDGTHFRRQVVIGSAIADFACVPARLIVEVDGGGHGTDEGRQRDTRRTNGLEAAGWRVIRFWNHEIFRELDSVLETIRANLEIPHPARPAAESDPPRERGG